jgi:S-adenosylmethionine:tRNA ribosyltransferase-isomerase
VNLSPFSYELPAERIAQRPVHPPESARMAVASRSGGTVTDATFADITRYLSADDLLVFNDTKVIPARLFGRLDNAAQSPVELLLLERIDERSWVCLGRPLKKIRSVGSITFSPTLTARLLPSPDLDRVRVTFNVQGETSVDDELARHGTMPIPPYIRDGVSDEQDAVDYQSIFAKEPGSVAAPTASLHFSPELIERIKRDTRCRIVTITLHVGSASFQPIMVDGVLRPPSSEKFAVPEQVMREVRETRSRRGGRVIAVGTTVVRALESAALEAQASGPSTDLFIQPGFQFRAVDGLVTNFHQPGTTHLLLVEALLGRELLECTYSHALESGYRFLSYGDGMLIT